MSDFKLGDLVWAKMKGFPPWPGQISEPPKDVKNKPAGKKAASHWIYFFGTKNFGWIDTGNLKPYVHSKHDIKKAPKTAAFKEACEAIEDVYLKGEASQYNPKFDESAFDRLVGDNGKSPKTPKLSEPSTSKGKTPSSKKKTPKSEKRPASGRASEESDVSDSEPSTSKGSRRKSKTPLKKESRKSLKGKNSDKQSDTASSMGTDDEDSGYKTNLGKGKRSSTVRSDAKRLRASQSFSAADTTTSVGWSMGPIDYSSPGRRPLLERPTFIRPETPPLDLNSISQTLIDKNITPSNLKFGFLGLGVMGSGIVKNLLNSGHHVIVWNRTPDKSAEFAKAGAEMGLTPQDVVQMADVTFSCVSDPQAARDMVFGNCGALQEINSSKSYVEMTGIDPETSRDLAKAMAARGGRYLEAQLQGSKKEADEGSLIILSAGDRSLYNECHSCFEAFGKSSFFLGEVGTAVKMNLAIQSLNGIMLSGLAEILSLADKIGLQLTDVLEVLSLTNMSSPYLIGKGKHIIDCHFTTELALTHLQKDLNLTIQMSQNVDQPLPITAISNEVFKHAKRLGYGDHDAAAVFIRARF